MLDEGIYRHNGVKWVSGTSITGLCVSAAEGTAQGSVDLGQSDLRHVWHASTVCVDGNRTQHGTGRLRSVHTGTWPSESSSGAQQGHWETHRVDISYCLHLKPQPQMPIANNWIVRTLQAVNFIVFSHGSFTGNCAICAFFVSQWLTAAIINSMLHRGTFNIWQIQRLVTNAKEMKHFN